MGDYICVPRVCILQIWHTRDNSLSLISRLGTKMVLFIVSLRECSAAPCSNVMLSCFMSSKLGNFSDF